MWCDPWLILTQQQSDYEVSFQNPHGDHGSVILRKWITRSSGELSKHLFAKPKGGRTLLASMAGSQGTETVCQRRQLCGNPSAMTVFGHALRAEPRYPGKGKMTESERKMEKETQWVMSISISAHGEHTVNTCRLAKYLMAFLSPWDLLPLIGLWAEWAWERATQFSCEERMSEPD